MNMMTAYWMEINMEITAAYLSHTSHSFENGLTEFTSPSSAHLNKLFNEYVSLPYLKSSLPPCKQPACKQSPNSNLDLDACKRRLIQIKYLFHAKTEYLYGLAVNN